MLNLTEKSKFIRLRYLLALALFLSVAGLSAQQVPLDIFYRSNWQMVNPAAVDRAFYLSPRHNAWMFNSAFRQQWIGLEGAPRTYFVSLEYCPDLATNKAGYHLGATLIRDQTDALSTTGFHAIYSFFFPVPNNPEHVIHLGFSPGIVASALDVQKIRLVDPSDPAPNLNENRLFFDFAFGAMYRIRKDFYFGVSVPQLLGVKLNHFNQDSARINRRQHIYLHTGWFIEAGDYDYSNSNPPDQRTWVIEPSLWLRYVPGVAYSTVVHGFPFSIDANIRVYRLRAVWAGLGYGTNGMATAEFGVGKKIGNGNRIQVGFASGFPLGRKRLALGPSAELTAAYSWY